MDGIARQPVAGRLPGDSGGKVLVQDGVVDVCREQRRAQDNLEWLSGFGDRFGLIHVNFDTLERTPKLSAQWFREAARYNAVV
jgi:hypothetical protein